MTNVLKFKDRASPQHALEPRQRTLFVIPAHNEQETIASVVGDILQRTHCPVVVVDDLSTDATAKRAREAGALVISLPVRLGAWGATQTGLKYAARRGFLYVATVDADGQHSLEGFDRLITEVCNNRADVCIGICPERVSQLRRVAWGMFRLMTGLNIEDLTSGYRVYNARAVSVLTSRSARFVDYQDVGVILLLRAAGLRVAEEKVEMFQRRSGSSRVYNSWYTVITYMSQTLMLCASKWSWGLHKERYRDLQRTWRER